MKYVDSGNGKIPLLTLIAILSISLIVNLPGLAISPIEGKLHQVFPHVTDLEIQLLQVLPNFVVIPFILLTGKICNQRNQIVVLGIGLIIFVVTGILYLFASTMVHLIVLGCLLGVGCGLVIPLAASLISQNFSGEQRARTLGWKSGLSNASVIVATLFVGWMAQISWHLSFVVYLIPIVPLLLLPFMRDSYISRHRIGATPSSTLNDSSADRPKFPLKRALWILAGIMALYIAITYGTIVVSYYVPFTMQHYHLDPSKVGVATSMYYLSAAVAGFSLSALKRFFGSMTMQAALLLIVLGLLGVGLVHHNVSYIVAIFVVGFGYGILQPMIYEKTTYIAPNQQASTRYFAYLLTGNYVGIACVPFIVDGMSRLFHASGNTNFSYILNAVLIAIVLVVALWKKRSFVFAADSRNYSPSYLEGK